MIRGHCGTLSILHTNVWICRVSCIWWGTKVEFNCETIWNPFISKTITFSIWDSKWRSNLCLNLAINILDNQSKPLSIIFNAYISFTFHTRMQKLYTYISLKSKCYRLLNLICDLTRRFTFGVCKSQCKMTSPASCVGYRYRIIVMLRFI